MGIDKAQPWRKIDCHLALELALGDIGVSIVKMRIHRLNAVVDIYQLPFIAICFILKSSYPVVIQKSILKRRH